jgi:WD40 repeat protein
MAFLGPWGGIISGLVRPGDGGASRKGNGLARPLSAIERRQGPTYDAFVSYSHHQDRLLAEALQSELQRFARPWYRPRALRVFRDATDLAASPKLWPSIERALGGSSWFVLMASPASADSRWVQKELGWWLEHRGADRILLALTDGTITWAGSDFDWEQTDAIPPLLSGKFTHEPLWIDLRKLRPSTMPEESIDARARPRLGDIVAEFAAPIHGRAKDELAGEHIRYQRRTRRLVRAVVAALTALLVTAASGAVVAVTQRNAARRQTLTATSRQLVAEATSIQDAQPNLARQLLAEAYRLAPTDQAVGALLGSSVIPRVIPTRGYSRGVAFSRHRDLLAVVSEEGVTLYDSTADRALATLRGQQASGSSVAFSHDDRVLAADDADGSIRLWDVTSARRPRLLGTVRPTLGRIEDLAFARDARFLMVEATGAAIGMVDVQDPHHPKLVATIAGFETSGTQYGLTVSPDGTTVASEGPDGTVRLWDLSTPRNPALRAKLNGPTGALAFSPDGHLLVVGGSNDDAARLWDVSDPAHPRQRAMLTGQSLGIDAVAFSPDRATLAVGAGDGTILLWDVADPIRPKQGARLIGHGASIVALAFSRDGRTLASASADGAATADGSSKVNSTVRLWSLTGSERTGALAGLPSVSSSLPVFTPDGRTMATGFPMTLWDLSDRANPRALATVPTFSQGQPAVALSPDGHTLASGVPVVLWDVTDRAHPRALTPGTALKQGATAVTFSPTGRLLATAALSDPVELWDISRPSRPVRLATLPASRLALQASQGVAFRRDGRVLATLSADDAVQLWDVANPATPELQATLRPAEGTVQVMAFSPDQRTLLTGDSAGVVTSWDLRALSRPHQLGAVGRHTGTIGGLAYHPGGTIAASASDDGTIRLWNVRDPSRPFEMTALPAGGLYASAVLAFSPDGHTLAAASEHGLQLWDVDVFGILQRLCAQSPAISPAQWRQYLPDQPYDPPCA